MAAANHPPGADVSEGWVCEVWWVEEFKGVAEPVDQNIRCSREGTGRSGCSRLVPSIAIPFFSRNFITDIQSAQTKGLDTYLAHLPGFVSSNQEPVVFAVHLILCRI